MRKNKFTIIFLLFIAFYSFLLRQKNLNTPFWVDEFSTASQAKILLDPSLRTSSVLERNNFTTHAVTATSFYFFGISTETARYPSVLFGVFVPVAVFFLASHIYNKKIGALSSLLVATSYFEILWSRQARGYVLQQLIILTTLFLYFKSLKKSTWLTNALLILIIILGLLTHTTYLIVLAAIFLHWVFLKKESLIRLAFKPINYIFLIAPLALLYFSGQLKTILAGLTYAASQNINNLAYYHSYLWREQTIITFLAFFGVLISINDFAKNKDKTKPLLLIGIVIIFLIFLSFLFSPYVSRYLLPIFPILAIFAGLTLYKLSEVVFNKNAFLWSLLILVFIIANGHRFVLKPKNFYSINHEMREIAQVDYDKIYQMITNKGDLLSGNTAVIDTWTDRSRWYIGNNQQYFYNYRWENNDGLVNGLGKTTQIGINENGERYVLNSGNPPVKFIGNINDLMLAQDKYKKGFIIIDDSSLPQDVMKYVKNNFKVEMYTDHYHLDDNPYSIWPLTLYSWGI